MRIQATIEAYEQLYEAAGGLGTDDRRMLVADVVETTGAWAPELLEEMEGLAKGAGVDLSQIVLLNARTEALARVGHTGRGECSVAVRVGDAGDVSAIQTWDWHQHLRDHWLIWSIDHLDGRRVKTLTEYGIVGKIGVNAAGVAILINILHHATDGSQTGVPVHLIARHVLDSALTINDALMLITAVKVSASSAITVIASEEDEVAAVTVELFPDGPAIVLPSDDGILIHTNHFLTTPANWNDREVTVGPDSFFRYDLLRRRLMRRGKADEASVLNALSSHLGAGGALCCHPDPNAEMGARYETLATVAVDPRRFRLAVHAGGPCSLDRERWEAF
jgi:isopenicillin-N N-acyltransferase like protein